MNEYMIKIVVEDVGGVYSANSMEEAERIGRDKCDEIYARMGGKCTVYVDGIEKIK